MSRNPQEANGKGSLKDIQVLINEKTSLINNRIKEKFKDLIDDEIDWVSPKDNDDFAEYRDDCFLEKVGLNSMEIKLNEFWPQKGPQWDALAKTTKGSIILVEAKANIPEVISPPTGAGNVSKSLILKSLYETKWFLSIKNDIDWSGTFYQYTNRLAHLYFLREKCKKQVFLVNVYFIGDNTVKYSPKTKQEWEAALIVVKKYLGLPKKHKLSKYMVDIFIDINEVISQH
jgi:hypothetical protein